MEQKYIRVEGIGFIIWPVGSGELWHKHVFESLMRAPKGAPAVTEAKLISAGFCQITPQLVMCYGRSESLDKKSHPDDSVLLMIQLGMSAPMIERIGTPSRKPRLT